jgi:hypothetical protein
MSVLVRRAVRATRFSVDHPEWCDLAYEVLFRRDAKEPYDLQYAVAQALMLAWKMGQEGKEPPRPKGMEARRREAPEPDPEAEEIFAEMRMLAWSPLAGTEKPEGHFKWAIKRHFEQKAARVAPKTVSRRSAAPSAPTVIRRSR